MHCQISLVILIEVIQADPMGYLAAKDTPDIVGRAGGSFYPAGYE
jgi:hypothetical protein